MKQYDTVIIKSTKEVCTIQKVETTSMGRSVYYLDSKEFVSDYPFYEQDLTLVDDELLHNGYNEYLDEGGSMRNVLEECDRMEGIKFDKDKIRHSLLVPEFIEDVLKVLEVGASKYGDFNWKGLDKTRVENALYRHFLSFIKGDIKDEETGKNHMVHVACNAMFLYYLSEES